MLKKYVLAVAVLFALSSSVSAKPHTDYSGAFAHPVQRSGIRVFAQITSHGTTITFVASTSAPGCTAPYTLGYNVFRGTATGAESSTPLNATPIAGSPYFDPVTLTSSPQTFFYTIEAVETSGGVTVSSGPSNEVSASFPGIPAPPTQVVGTPK